MALSLAQPPESANVRQLAQWKQDRVTGLTTAIVALSQAVDVASGILLCWKNGTLVDPATITVNSHSITLGSALTGTDVVVVYFKAKV